MGPSRLQRYSCRTLLVCTIVIAACCTGGCRPRGSAAGGDAGDGSVPVQPAWRKFAEENYYGIVQAGLPASSMVTARFPGKPTITASRGADGKIDLVAVGEVETTSLGGTRMRQPASVMWHQSGGGWEMVFRDIGAASPAPAPPAPPAVGPATAPAQPPPDPAGGAPGAP